MMKSRPFPWPGFALAVLGGLAMLVSGVNIILVAAILIVWTGSLWLPSPTPEIQPTSTAKQAISQAGISELIEPFMTPLLILERGRIAVANRAARELLGAHISGQDARVAFRHPDAIAIIDGDDDIAITVSGITGPGTVWEMSRRRINRQYAIIEMADRTSEADISRVHTDFVANASHELRTPLASIIGYVETLLDEDDPVEPATAKKFHTTVLREAKRLQSLVSDLMSLSRVEAEKRDRPNDQVELGALVRQASLDAIGPDRSERLVFVLPDEAALIDGDRRQLEQLVRNLVDNADKYGAPDKPVTLSIICDDQKAVLIVTDEGEGIDSRHIPHLTRRFYRTDPGRSRAAGGTGLGLAIVKHIVERHRGSLDIISERGKGTSVTVQFPKSKGSK
ncbi:sensor histidine kinase [Altererythrobacter aquiaggeris]|uniref:sensor histidine kinase n=1 Tax=Aestuarierythrobacter aquiaggeris TaxID=1898396 RepID=UPI0030170693